LHSDRLRPTTRFLSLYAIVSWRAARSLML